MEQLCQITNTSIPNSFKNSYSGSNAENVRNDKDAFIVNLHSSDNNGRHFYQGLYIEAEKGN